MVRVKFVLFGYIQYCAKKCIPSYIDIVIVRNHSSYNHWMGMSSLLVQKFPPHLHNHKSQDPTGDEEPYSHHYAQIQCCQMEQD